MSPGPITVIVASLKDFFSMFFEWLIWIKHKYVWILKLYLVCDQSLSIIHLGLLKEKLLKKMWVSPLSIVYALAMNVILPLGIPPAKKGNAENIWGVSSPEERSLTSNFCTYISCKYCEYWFKLLHKCLKVLTHGQISVAVIGSIHDKWSILFISFCVHTWNNIHYIVKSIGTPVFPCTWT